ncbi:hypothetical protein TcasGA2_TC031259 [Tribolium castaneum]|uniref:Reverse transcriptase domain-containing protein n=1 Tax=Tribolium castaneum TaxID=7070 RepID=A0A139W9I9_TRICA|nr:hypothetical protein TcasGA2_TC031259 [Tribolium castaneum]
MAPTSLTLQFSSRNRKRTQSFPRTTGRLACCRLWERSQNVSFAPAFSSSPRNGTSSPTNNSAFGRIIQQLISYYESSPGPGSRSPPGLRSFTHDIPKTDRTTLAIYADDTAILTRSKQPYMATRYLQESVERIENWCRRWLIKVNPDKSRALLLARRRVSPDGFVRMFNADIPWSDQVKYLGVILDKKLSFGPHLDYALAKGKLVTGIPVPKNAEISRMSAERVVN